MSNKTFKYVGVSTLNGVRKVRYATDLDRIKVLIRNGHTDVDFKELATAMTKEQIAETAEYKSLDLASKKTTVKAPAKAVQPKASVKTKVKAEVSEPAVE